MSESVIFHLSFARPKWVCSWEACVLLSVWPYYYSLLRPIVCTLMVEITHGRNNLWSKQLKVEITYGRNNSGSKYLMVEIIWNGMARTGKFTVTNIKSVLLKVNLLLNSWFLMDFFQIMRGWIVSYKKACIVIIIIVVALRDDRFLVG